MAKAKRLYRTPKDKVLTGLFGGMGEYLGIDPVILRLTFLFIVVLTGFFPGVIFYILGAVITPKKAAN
jgi:phage shock protein C